jgi:peptidylprolyl isomerase
MAILGLIPLTPAHAATALAGEAFGQPVTQEEYDFALKTAGIFSTSGKELATDDDRRQEAWKNIVFLREAKTRGIRATKEEIKAELDRLLAEKQIAYGSLAYIQFVEENFHESPEIFEKRIENLLTVKKLIGGIMNPPPPVITDEQCYQKYLNQYNSMNVEFINVPTLEEAQKLYKNLTPAKWDAEKKKNPKFSTPTGHISLEAHIDLWQLPKDDAYRIHDMKVGQIAAPAKMYKGYGVYRLTEKKDADPKQYDEKKHKEYVKVLEQVYYYEKTQKVVQDIIKRSDMKDYARDKILVFETNQGTFEIQLYPTVAPKACENIIALAEKGYYDGLLFFRVVKGFMIQTGDPSNDGTGGKSIWGEPFADEVNKDVQFEKAGMLGMANSGPNTNGSQFFITLAPTPHLNMKHTVFGEVIKGIEVVRKIGETPVKENDRPRDQQKIIKVRLKKWQTTQS